MLPDAFTEIVINICSKDFYNNTSFLKSLKEIIGYEDLNSIVSSVSNKQFIMKNLFRKQGEDFILNFQKV